MGRRKAPAIKHGPGRFHLVRGHQHVPARTLQTLHLIRHDDPDRHDLRVKNVQLRLERLAAERAGNVRRELNELIAASRRIAPNAQIATTRADVAAYYQMIHGHPPHHHR